MPVFFCNVVNTVSGGFILLLLFCLFSHLERGWLGWMDGVDWGNENENEG